MGLIAIELVAAALILVGPAADDANRTAGVLTMVAIAALTIVIALRGLPALAACAAILTVICAFLAIHWNPALLDDPTGLAEFGPLVPTGGSLPFLHPHAVGLAAVPGLLSASILAWHARRRRTACMVWIAAALVDGVVVYASQSRTAAVGSLVGLIVALECTIMPDRGRALLIASATAVGVVVVAAALSLNDPHVQDRVRIWRLAVDALWAHPLSGLGFGRLPFYYADVIPNWWERATNAHDVFLQTWSDFGALGLVGLALIALNSMRSALRLPSEARVVWILFVSCFAAAAVTGFTEALVTLTVQSETSYVTFVSPALFLISAAPLRMGRAVG